jgi:hypothetical protein
MMCAEKIKLCVAFLVIKYKTPSMVTSGFLSCGAGTQWHRDEGSEEGRVGTARQWAWAAPTMAVVVVKVVAAM